ncbi:MAG TPA: hypothetical protein VFW00_11740 [Rhodocyclaceae bacterium]|nr:hypothetical protein [Rhodocyclaceae bacterium]
MRKYSFLAIFLACLTLSAYAADTLHFTYEEAMSWERTKKILDPSIKLYWVSQPTPELAEKSRPDIYTHSGISVALFGGSAKHCMEAFADDLESMIGDAHERGYDAIVDLQVVHDGKPSSDLLGFECTPGYRTTEVSLSGSFGVTPETARRAEEAEKASIGKAPTRTKPPAKNAIFLPLESVLNSPEAKAILGPDIKVHWGSHNAPAYRERFGPDHYSDDASVKTFGPEGACKQAVLNVLKSMVDDVKEKGYDSIIKITSFVNEQPALADTDFECEVDSKSASVELLGTLVSTK